MDRQLSQQVRDRAKGICEYCRMPSSIYDQPFHIDHIRSRKHGGSSDLDNLAFACLDCNAFKGTDVAGYDPDTGVLTTLYNPRAHAWTDHFAWNGPVLVGVTAIGRTTVQLLNVNQAIRVRARAVLIAEGAFPPT